MIPTVSLPQQPLRNTHHNPHYRRHPPLPILLRHPRPHTPEDSGEVDLTVEGRSVLSSRPPVVLVSFTSDEDWEDFSLPCGLRRSEAFGLMLREITAEDYDTLLQLDETVKKRVVSSEQVKSLPVALAVADDGKCGICLNSFVPNEPLKELKCSHRFHPACIDEWLLNFSSICPIDGLPI